MMQLLHTAELLHLVVKLVSEPFGPKKKVTSLEPMTIPGGCSVHPVTVSVSAVY